MKLIMKGVCRREFVQLLIVPTLLAGGIGPAVACGYDGAPVAGLRHPRAIEVAAALRNASNAQTLDRQLVAPTFVNMMGYHRAIRRLQRLRDSLERAVHERKLPGTGFSLLLVEAGLWSRYVFDGEGVSIAIHTPGPQSTDAIVFTGEAVIEAIASGRLSAEEAFRRGLIVIDGAPGTNRDVAALLRDALCHARRAIVVEARGGSAECRIGDANAQCPTDARRPAIIGSAQRLRCR